METYEQKYKAALERARQFSEHPLQEDSANIVEYIFPELAESEDERIRKAIKKALQVKCCDNEYGHRIISDESVTLEEALAWLEKQGQVKESVISQHDNKICKENDDSLTSEDERIRKELIFYLGDMPEDTELRNGVTNRDVLVWLEKQGEQNQKQYDIDVLEKHITKDSISELAHTVIVRNGWEIVDAKEQKYAWSKEDDAGLDDALWCCKQAGTIAKDENDMGNVWYAEHWLKSLKSRTHDL